MTDSKNDINDYTEDKKEELQIFIDENMNDFATDLEVRKEINYLSGAEYKENNIFGSDLKSITKGQMYYYNTKPYMAIKTANNNNGFIAPDNTNFFDITNKNLMEKIEELKEFYYAPISNLIGTFPSNNWTDWVNLDTKATHIVVVLEHINNLKATFEISLKALKVATDYQYNLNCGTTWNLIRLRNGKIQISSPTNGSGNNVKLVNAFYYK